MPSFVDGTRTSCVQASMELGPEDVSLLEMCPHFRVQASMELSRMLSKVEMCSLARF